MKLILLTFLTLSSLFAGNCNDTLFSFDITESKSKVRIIDIIENISEECSFSVKIKDKATKKLLYTNLYLVHIENYTLEDMFDFLFTQNNIFHKYNTHKKVLNISYLQTRSFTIDYVNLSEHTTQSTKSITVGASSTSGSSSSSSSGSAVSSGATASSGSSGRTTGGTSNSDSTTITTLSKFQFWDTLAQEIDSILSRDNDIKKIHSRSIINREAGIITITGTRNQVDRISKYLSKIKKRLHKQVMLETKIFELTYYNSDSVGVDWTKFDLSFNGDIGKLWNDNSSSTTRALSYSFSIDGLMSFLHKYGKVDVLSTPKVLTLNNQPAVINVGEQLNYRYQSGTLSTVSTTTSSSNTYDMGSVFIGLTLNIVPEITDNDYVVLRINPVVSEKIDPESSIDSGNGDIVDSDGVRIMPPDIRIKQLSSIIKAKDGNRIIVGGLISSIIKNTNSKIPLLGDIPGVGWLFKNKSKSKYKTELIIVITPTIIKESNFPSIDSIEKNLEGGF